MMSAGPLLLKEPFERYARFHPGPWSVFSFAPLFLWADHFSFRWQLIDGNLCVWAQSEVGIFLYLPPMGEVFSLSAVEECFRIMAAQNGPRGVTRIDNVPEQMLRHFPQEEFSFYKKGDEYGYGTEDIALLKGNPYKSKRSSTNHFIKNYAGRFLPYQEEMQGSCLELYDRWAEERKKRHPEDINVQMLEDNRLVQRRCFNFFRELNLVGRVVEIDNQIRAYTVGFAINPGTFCILIEIADVSTQGLPVFIFSEFCRELLSQGFATINCLDDSGLEHLAKTKESFHPRHLWPLYTVTRKTQRSATSV